MIVSTDSSLRARVAEFYAYETMLLDDGRLREWLDLLDNDLRYLMPLRETSLGDPVESGNPRFDLFNDDKASLTARVARLETGMALVESPPSASQRLVTDVLILGHGSNHADVRSSFLIVQVRDEQNEILFAGRRVDHLIFDGDLVRVRRREILLVHYVLPRTISLFF